MTDLLTEVLDRHGADSPAPGARLYCGDAFELLRELPTQSVDLVFADPPYWLSNGGTTVQNGRRVSVDKGAWDASSGNRVDRRFHKQWLRYAQRVLRPTGSLWVSGTQHCIFAIGWSMEELGYNLLNTVTWFKPNASPNLACRMFTHSTELLIWASPAAPSGKLLHTFNYPEMKAENGDKQMRDLWQMPEVGGEQVVWSIPPPARGEKTHGRHTTQKPLELLRRIITASTRPGDVVVDPFCGSSTTGVACLETGRRYVGIEVNPEYHALSLRRMAAYRG